MTKTSAENVFAGLILFNLKYFQKNKLRKGQNRKMDRIK